MVRASISQANGVPDPEKGHYATLVYAGCESRERADEIKRALFRSARYVGVSVSASVKAAGDGTYAVTFKAIDKSYAKKYMIEHFGADRSKWPYDPRARNK